MTTFAPKFFADGQLPIAQGVLFTAAADVGSYLKSFSLFNNNAVTQVIILWLKRANGSGIARQWKRYELAVNEWAEVIDEDTQSIELEVGDQILGITTTAGAVDYDISGVTEVN
jgi:hypothetical protein